MAVFDIDMTLLNNQQRYTDAKRAGVVDKDGKAKRKTRFETPGKAFKRAQDFLFDASRLEKDRLIAGAADFVNQLVEDGYVVAYCTGRRLTYYEVTRAQLERKGFPIMKDDQDRELLFMRAGGSKTTPEYKKDVLSALNAAYDVRFFFDDLPENLAAAAQVGIPGLYLSISDYSKMLAKPNPSAAEFFPGDTTVAPHYMTAQTIPITALQNPPVKPRRKKMKNGKYRKEPAKKYIDRFMGNAKMNKEFPDRGQRYAVSLGYVEKFYGKRGLDSVGARRNPEEYSEDYMVPRDIHRLGKAADRLEDTYEDGQEVPEWWKSKMSVTARDADTLSDALDYVAQNPSDCPPATQSLEINTKNRNNAIQSDYIRYGPLNLNDLRYYDDAAAHWKTDVATAKKSKCSNCVAFDISPRMLDCMPGPVSQPIEDEEGYLGYCWMHHFKCHSARTCYTWAAGGPITENKVSMEWQDRAFAKKNPSEELSEQARYIIDYTDRQEWVERALARGREIERIENKLLTFFRDKKEQEMVSEHGDEARRIAFEGDIEATRLGEYYAGYVEEIPMGYFTRYEMDIYEDPRDDMRVGTFQIDRGGDFDGEVEFDLSWEHMNKLLSEAGVRDNPASTLPIFTGTPTSKFTNKGMVSAEVQIGRNVVKDVGEVVQSIYRGLIGGRTSMAERRMAMAVASMQKELSDRAKSKGANAIANLNVDYELVTQSATLTLIATADAIKMTRPPKQNPGHSRDSLPFRPTSDCFLTYKGKLVAKDMGHYIAFPGGGVDPGESPKAAAKREVMEEVGAVLKGNLRPMGDISWVWNPEWADSPKRKKRYQQFQGEQVYFFTGEVEKFVKPTSDEGDAWSGKKLMKFSDAIAYLQAEKANLKHPNQAKYIDYQIACLSQIQKAKGKMTGAQYRAGVKKMLEARANPLPLMGLSVQVSGYRNAAGAFVMKGKKFLILQRSTKETSMHGLWELPGGKVEEGETPRQTAVIEVKEEAGLDIKLKSNLGPHHDNKKKKTYHAYIATAKKGQKVKLSEEHSAHKWMTPEEVMAMPKNMVSHHLLYFLKKKGEAIRNNPRKNPSDSKKIEKGKKLYKHMNGKEPDKVEKKQIDMGDVWYQVGEGGCWQIGYMSGKETGDPNQKYTHTFNEETQDGNFPKLYATMPENGKPLLIIQGGTWKIRTDDKGVAWIYD